MNRYSNNIVKKIIKAFRLLCTYIIAKAILTFHYDKHYFIEGKGFRSSKYGEFTASGWSLVVNDFFLCKKFRVNMNVPWPVSPRISIVNPYNIKFHPDDINNFQGFGNYYQAIGSITIGQGTYIACNVGIITSNHSLMDLDEHDQPKSVTIGNRCWIGMNSVLLPGITLGDNTIVGAGSIVTKSFPYGNCIIAGNPAKTIRLLSEHSTR